MHHEDESEPALPVEKDLLADDESNEHHANQRALAVRLLAHARVRRAGLNTWCHARRTFSKVWSTP